IPRVDGELDAEPTLDGSVLPLHRRETLRLPAQRLHVRTVVAVDRDPLAERDVTDDLVAGYRSAALREPDENVRDAVHLDADLAARHRLLRLRRARRDRLFLGDLLDLQPLDHLVHDLRRAELSGSEREVEVLGLLEPGLPN